MKANVALGILGNVLVLGISVVSHSPGAWAEDRVFKANEVVRLERPTDWTYDKITFEPGATILTNGHRLGLRVNRSLTAAQGSGILAFEAPVGGLSVAPVGRNGIPGSPSFDPGPSTSDPVLPRTEGQGGNGGRGEDGALGRAGLTPDSISIFVAQSASATGRLIVRNAGANGGRGGVGGTGGAGGNGEQGGRATPNEVLPGIVIGCRSGPGRGGAAGSGATGGTVASVAMLVVGVRSSCTSSDRLASLPSSLTSFPASRGAAGRGDGW